MSTHHPFNRRPTIIAAKTRTKRGRSVHNVLTPVASRLPLPRLKDLPSLSPSGQDSMQPTCNVSALGNFHASRMSDFWSSSLFRPGCTSPILTAHEESVCGFFWHFLKHNLLCFEFLLDGVIVLVVGWIPRNVCLWCWRVVIFEIRRNLERSSLVTQHQGGKTCLSPREKQNPILRKQTSTVASEITNSSEGLQSLLLVLCVQCRVLRRSIDSLLLRTRLSSLLPNNVLISSPSPLFPGRWSRATWSRRRFLIFLELYAPRSTTSSWPKVGRLCSDSLWKGSQAPIYEEFFPILRQSWNLVGGKWRISGRPRRVSTVGIVHCHRPLPDHQTRQVFSAIPLHHLQIDIDIYTV